MTLGSEVTLLKINRTLLCCTYVSTTDVSKASGHLRLLYKEAPPRDDVKPSNQSIPVTPGPSETLLKINSTVLCCSYFSTTDVYKASGQVVTYVCYVRRLQVSPPDDV